MLLLLYSRFFLMINACEWLHSEDVISVANIVTVVGNAAIQRWAESSFYCGLYGVMYRIARRCVVTKVLITC